MNCFQQVDWTDEDLCFKSFLRELAYFYIPIPLLPLDNSESLEDIDESPERKLGMYLLLLILCLGETLVDSTLPFASLAELYQIEHVIFPALRRYLVPPKSLLKGGHLTQVANLPDLYKVFERC